MITVYSKSGCVQCAAVKRYLSKHQTPYRELRLDSGSSDEIESLMKLGYTQVPVVFDSRTGKHFYGFDTSNLEEIVKGYKGS